MKLSMTVAGGLECYNRKHMMTVQQTIKILDTIAPRHLAMDWDNKGLIIGNPDMPVSGIGVSLDITKSVVEWAIENNINLLIAHHPLLFTPQKTILETIQYPDAVIIQCIKHNISVTCAHTNWDITTGGINDVLADIVGLKNTKPLEITSPTLGLGLGRIGDLTTPTTSDALITHLQHALNYLPIRPTPGVPTDTLLTRIAVGGGACAHLVPLAIREGAQALITSDVRHHEFVSASAQGFQLIDAGHAATEIPGTKELARRLQEAMPSVTVMFSESV
jgi:dinuclear metal center YbgI/SA1388 family protein